MSPAPSRLRDLGFALGPLAGVAVSFGTAGTFGALDGALLGWCVGALVHMAVSIYMMAGEDAYAHAASMGARESERTSLLWLSLGAAAVALLVILVDLADAEVSVSKTGDVAIALLAIVVTWFFIQVAFAQHYAHELRIEGLSLTSPGAAKPGFWDLMYVALMIGITYQSSDVTAANTALRRRLIAHSLMSFVFNTVILALVINLAAALAS